MSPVTTESAISLARVLEAVQRDPGISPTRGRDMISALRRFASLLDQSLEDLPASVPALASRMRGIEPAFHGLSSKTWANMRSNALAAVRLAGLAERRPNALTPDWAAFLSQLPSTQLRWRLGRLARWCSAQGVSPEAVNLEVLETFREWLEVNAPVRNPRRFCGTVARAWNEARRDLSGWHLAELPPPRPAGNRLRRLPLESFPVSFQGDLDAYCAMRADPDPFDPAAPPRPAKATTIKLYREQARLAPTALVERGYRPETITSLRVLVEPEAFKDILRQLLAEHDGAGNHWTEGMRKFLITLARHWCRLPETDVAELRALSRRVPKPEPGLTSKNRKALRQFDDPANLARLLHLPERLFREALRANSPGERGASLAQIALAIEILLNIPIRAENLRRLQLGRHVLRPSGSKGPAFLCLEPGEVKNEQRIDFELPKPLAHMLDQYVKRFLPLLCGDGSHLFVSRNGNPKCYNALSAQICRTIRDRTGLVITLHQFRHLSAKVHLDALPGSYESVRQLLGHRSIQTTVRSYAGIETRRAARVHDDLLARRREELEHLARCRRPSTRKADR